jgi:uncharacterized protein YndB with AHSA1/START domain
MNEPDQSNGSDRRKITLERSYRASLDQVWSLWTTKEGIESWWGPNGFTVSVRQIDLRAGGELRYTMTATAPEQVAFMQQAGMPIATDSIIVYTEIEPMRRLGYRSVADFIPDIPPYDVATSVTLEPEPDGVRMVLTFDAMHDAQWTERAVMGHESELSRLDNILNATA